MLVSDIATRVRNSAGDLQQLQFSHSVLTNWINDAVRECVVENGLLQGRASTSTVVGQKEYTLPVGILKLHSVVLGGIKIPVLSFEQYQEHETHPSCYVYAGKLNLEPEPTKVESLEINYSSMPESVVLGGTDSAPTWLPDTPPIHEAFHSRLVSYCLAQVALQDEDNYRYNMLMQEFHTGVQSLKEIEKSEDDLYPFMSVSSRDAGDGYYG